VFLIEVDALHVICLDDPWEYTQYPMSWPRIEPNTSWIRVWSVTATPTCWVLILPTILRSRDSSVGTATGYGLDDRGIGVGVPVGSRIFSSPRRPDRLWGPPSLLPNGYGGLFHGVKAAGA
jgi:hypothetical protein